jgi:hypothetical protein
VVDFISKIKAVAAWFWYAVVAAVLSGAHQIFTRLPSERIDDDLGGFVVEASAAMFILLYLAFLGLPVDGIKNSACPDSITRCWPEFAPAPARLRFFFSFKKGIRFPPFQPF